MFDLVADVGRYAEFLPWVSAIRVRSDSETEMVADMIVGFKGLRETFTSQRGEAAARATSMSIISTGRSNICSNDWHFRADGQGGCLVDFSVDFAFKNRVFEMLAGQVFDRGAAQDDRRVRGRAPQRFTAPIARDGGQQQFERAQRRLKPDAAAAEIAELPCDRRRHRRDRAPFSARAKTTVPTGFFSLPPPGPAMPVIATATSAPRLLERALRHAPGDRDRDRAEGLEHVAADTLSSPSFASLE